MTEPAASNTKREQKTPVTPPTKPAPTGPSATVRTLSLGFFCFALSFLGAWAALSAGLIQNENSLTEKRSVVSQEAEVVADVAERVSPSVVSIITESETAVGFRSFTQQSAGTGIIISKSGYVLTNKHVVEGSSDVSVVLADGTAYEDVEFVGSDPANDIAFLKINGGKNLQAATIGDSSDIEVGEKVIAIGNALGQYQTTVTSGIISGLGRPLVAGDRATGEAERLTNLLQTDAAINPGNSGGPLVNLEGEVIGINTAVDEDAEGIGFAIPINDTKGLIESVKESGKVERAFLGVAHLMVTPEVVKEFELSTNYGAYINNVDGEAITSGSPAARAGLRQGDTILKVNGKKLGATYPLLSAISTFQSGDTVKLTFMREGKEQTVDVRLATFPRD